MATIPQPSKLFGLVAGRSEKSCALREFAGRPRHPSDWRPIQSHEGAESFSELARQYSAEESTRNCGGYLGAVRPRMLPARVDEAVFAARVNEVRGPFAESGYWTVYKVEAIRDAEMSGVTRKEIEDRLFKAWLQRAIAASRFEKPK